MTPDSLLTNNDKEELLSKAYAYAVAVKAGYVTAEYDKDRDGIDLRIQAGGDMRPALDLQLKATVNLRHVSEEYVSFPLPRRNYDLLRIGTQTPRLLVVFELPKSEEEWVTVTDDELVIRHRAYWLSLSGWEETEHTTSITVRIPKRNRFNVDGLKALMDQSRRGKGIQ